MEFVIMARHIITPVITNTDTTKTDTIKAVIIKTALIKMVMINTDLTKMAFIVMVRLIMIRASTYMAIIRTIAKKSSPIWLGTEMMTIGYFSVNCKKS